MKKILLSLSLLVSFSVLAGLSPEQKIELCDGVISEHYISISKKQCLKARFKVLKVVKAKLQETVIITKRQVKVEVKGIEDTLTLNTALNISNDGKIITESYYSSYAPF